MAEANLSKFDPEACPQGAYEGFCEFVEQFCYEYEAVAKEPPKIQRIKRLGLSKIRENCSWENIRHALSKKNMRIALQRKRGKQCRIQAWWIS